jgi:Skp family chaperone for outer membrane proteins
MKYAIYLTLLITALLLPLPAGAEQAADGKIAVVDVQQVVRNSLAAKDVSAQIEKKRVAHQAEITKQEENLEKRNQELSKQRAVLSPEAFEQKVKEFKSQVADVQRDVQRRRS